jgi:hypothetical protein
MNAGIYHGSDALLYVKAPNLVPDASSDFDTDGTPWWSCALATLSRNVGSYMVMTTATSVKGRIYKDFLQAGKVYNVRFRFKSTGYTGKIDVYIGTGTTVQSANVTSSWQNFNAEVTATTDGELSIELTSAYNGTVDFDDIIIQRTDDDIIDFTVIGHATSHDLDIKGELIVRRTKDTGKFPSRKLTGIDASVSIKALVLYDGYSAKNLLAAQLNGDTLMLKLAGHTNATWGVQEDEGDWFIQMPALVSNNSMSFAVNEDGSYTANFDLNGDLTIETVPA